MPVTTQLFAYGLRQVLGITAETASQLAKVAGDGRGYLRRGSIT
jgi:hypothetical protein